MEPITCLDCGFPLGQYYDAFIYMRTLITSKTEIQKINNKFIDPSINETLLPIFEALKINKYCCRGQLTSCKIMHEIGY